MQYTYIRIHKDESWTDTKIRRMFVSQGINIFCLIYLPGPIHRPSKYIVYRYICNCVNSTTPYHYHKYSTLNKPYLGSHSVLSHSALSFGTLDTRSNTTEANRVTEAGRTKRVMERRPKKLATVWVAILIVSQ